MANLLKDNEFIDPILKEKIQREIDMNLKNIIEDLR
jgi:hypothetical protein